MNVIDSFIIDSNHSIEWGHSTWNNGKDFSIRNRYNTVNGGFNNVASSEIPWDDFNEMILESIRRNYFSKDELKKIIGELLIK